MNRCGGKKGLWGCVTEVWGYCGGLGRCESVGDAVELWRYCGSIGEYCGWDCRGAESAMEVWGML